MWYTSHSASIKLWERKVRMFYSGATRWKPMVLCLRMAHSREEGLSLGCDLMQSLFRSWNDILKTPLPLLSLCFPQTLTAPNLWVWKLGKSIPTKSWPHPSTTPAGLQNDLDSTTLRTVGPLRRTRTKNGCRYCTIDKRILKIAVYYEWVMEEGFVLGRE